jgi:hypothetical protein
MNCDLGVWTNITNTVTEGACVRRKSLPFDDRPTGRFARVFCKVDEEATARDPEDVRIYIYGYEDANCRDRSFDKTITRSTENTCFDTTSVRGFWDKCSPTIPFEGSIPPMSGSAVVAARPPLMGLCLLLFATALFLGVGQRG